jgi:hypothetical protein
MGLSKEKASKIATGLRDYAEEEFDTLLVYLSSGALVLSIAFVKDVIAITSETIIWPLLAAWYCFASSLIAILFSHRTCLLASDNLHLFHAEENKAKKDIYGDKCHKYNDFTKLLNLSSSYLMTIGIVLFLIFATCNRNQIFKPAVKSQTKYKTNMSEETENIPRPSLDTQKGDMQISKTLPPTALPPKPTQK